MGQLFCEVSAYQHRNKPKIREGLTDGIPHFKCYLVYILKWLVAKDTTDTKHSGRHSLLGLLTLELFLPNEAQVSQQSQGNLSFKITQ